MPVTRSTVTGIFACPASARICGRESERDGPVKGEPAAVRESARAGPSLFHALQEFIHDPFSIPVAAACRSA